MIVNYPEKAKREIQVKLKYLSLLMIFLFCQFGVACSGPPGERILFDFETDEELDRFHWKCHTLFALSEEHATHGTKSLKMDLFPSEYPGLAPMIKDTDWSRYGALRFDVYNPQGKDIPLTVRIDDKKDYPDYADRYNRRFVVKPGANTVTIPLDSLNTSGGKRTLNPKRIYRFVIFMVQPKGRTTVYVDYARLVRKRDQTGIGIGMGSRIMEAGTSLS